MSIYIKPDVHVTIHQLETENAPRPLPLASGFSEDKSYQVLGVHTPSESAEAWLILRNDRDEMWFISNRHCRVVDAPLHILDGKIEYLNTHAVAETIMLEDVRSRDA